MHSLEVRPLRIVALFTAVLILAAYLPHPNLGEPLPKSLNSLLKVWVGQRSQS